MNLALLLALQAAGSTPPQARIASDFDLRTFRPSEEAERQRRCAGQDPSEIVVCGRRPLRNAYPLEEMERKFAAKPFVAETDIGGGATARAYLESVEMPGGQVSKRIMFGIKSKF